MGREGGRAGGRGRRPLDPAGRRSGARGIELPPLQRTETEDGIELPARAGELRPGPGPGGDHRVRARRVTCPDTVERVHELGAEFWPLAMTRELDDLILRLRANELELGTWIIRTKGDVEDALAFERVIAAVLRDRLAGQRDPALLQAGAQAPRRDLAVADRADRAGLLLRRGAAGAGPGLRPAVHAGRADGGRCDEEGEPAQIVLSDSNFGTFPMSNGLSRLASRFYGDDEHVAKLRQETGRRIEGAEALELGLVTDAPDDIDWDDEVRIMLEERASLSPDALTGMEANHRFVGPETMESRIFSRLSAWQNWIFVRPNASGEEGALRRFGTGRRAEFDKRRV